MKSEAGNIMSPFDPHSLNPEKDPKKAELIARIQRAIDDPAAKDNLKKAGDELIKLAPGPRAKPTSVSEARTDESARGAGDANKNSDSDNTEKSGPEDEVPLRGGGSGDGDHGGGWGSEGPKGDYPEGPVTAYDYVREVRDYINRHIESNTKDSAFHYLLQEHPVVLSDLMEEFRHCSVLLSDVLSQMPPPERILELEKGVASATPEEKQWIEALKKHRVTGSGIRFKFGILRELIGKYTANAMKAFRVPKRVALVLGASATTIESILGEHDYARMVKEGLQTGKDIIEAFS